MELKDLEGFHTLTGVDFDNYMHKDGWQGDDENGEQASVCYFTLDGVTYGAMEDPSDGYRSCLDELRDCGHMQLKNTFPPVKVLCLHHSSIENNWMWILGENTIADYFKEATGYGSDGEDDVIVMFDIAAKRPMKPVLTIGTDHGDSYYPSYIANFNPEAMAVNAEVPDEQE